jgi:amicyanin
MSTRTPKAARTFIPALYQRSEALLPYRHSRASGNPSPAALNSNGLHGAGLGSRPRGDGGGFWRLLLLLTMSFIPSSHGQEKVAANAPPPPPSVRIDNFTFTPAEITIAPGTALTWVNGDDIPHTVVATGKTFRSKVMDTEQQFSFTFNKPGTYEYFCSLHPHMKGKVVVK